MEASPADPVPSPQEVRWFLPAVALVTVWSTLGFNVLLFLAGLRNISPDLYEAATLDDAGRWRQFRSLTWPLIRPVTALVLTIQLILQLKVFDQVYLLSPGPVATWCSSNTSTRSPSQNESGYASAVALALFVIVMISVLQYQMIRARGAR